MHNRAHPGSIRKFLKIQKCTTHNAQVLRVPSVWGPQCKAPSSPPVATPLPEGQVYLFWSGSASLIFLAWEALPVVMLLQSQISESLIPQALSQHQSRDTYGRFHYMDFQNSILNIFQLTKKQ